jgi:arylsulfatase A-like enzyme/tetratricopeptide (TPR) repeat protein
MLLLLACAADPAPSEPIRRPNLVLVTLDTTRADRLGAYGYEDAQTPTFDALAAEGVRFERAYSPVPLTIPAHSSLFTGLYPPHHGVHDNGSAVLGDAFVTLAERLQSEGWATGASVGAFVTTRAWNLDQGFDAYFDSVEGKGRWSRERPAEEVMDDALAWVEQQVGPFFLWVHLYDAHDPYAAPEPWASRLAPYDAEVAYTDHHLGRLRDAVPDDTAWIVAADHGESLGEHGERTHGLLLYESVMRVPLVVRGPSAGPAQVVDTPVSLVDVLPTALTLMGIDVPEGLDGVDLSPSLSGAGVPARPLYLESWTAWLVYGFHPERAIVDGPWKWMATPSGRLFHVVEDPSESTSRLGEVALDSTLLDMDEVDAGSVSLSPEVRLQLDALGYLGAVDQPWREVDVKDRLHDVRALSQRGPDREERLLALLEADPEFLAAKAQLARLYSQSGRHAQALELYEGMSSENAVTQVAHARALAAAGRTDEAVALYEAVLQRLPQDQPARAGLVETLVAAARLDEALVLAEAWYLADPSLAAAASLGLLKARAGRLKEAETLLKASLVDGVPRPRVHLVLARLEDVNGEPDAVVAHIQAELAWFPESPEAHLLLGRAHMALGDWEAAEGAFLQVVALLPEAVEAHRGAAQAAFNRADYAACEARLAGALALEPNDPEVLLLLANLQDKQGRPVEAAATFERAKAARSAR